MIGEASLLENLQSEGGNFHQPSRATIVAEPGAAFVRWSQRSFFELQVCYSIAPCRGMERNGVGRNGKEMQRGTVF